MALQVRTGQTKPIGTTTLVAKSFTLENDEHAVVLLQIDADPATAKSLQKECFTLAKQGLLEAEGEPAVRLDSTLKELNGLVKGLLLSKTLEDFHAVIGLLDESGLLHVSHAGRAEAYVIRGGSASQITEYTRGKPTPSFVHIASGQLEERDAVVFSTQRLLRSLTPAQLATLAQKTDGLLGELESALEADKEQAALAILTVEGSEGGQQKAALPAAASRRRGRSARSTPNPFKNLSEALSGSLAKLVTLRNAGSSSSSTFIETFRERLSSLNNDLHDPKKKKRTHLLFLAGIVTIFLVVWATAHVTTFSQRSQTKAELEALVEQINQEIVQAESRRIAGDIDSANLILQRAEERTLQVMENESSMFRTEALDLASRIKAKREEINNVTRLSPRLVVNLAARKPAVRALGFIGLADEEFLAYDKQDLYRVLHNSIDEPDRLTDDESILDAVNFPRYQTQVFQVTGNTMLELINGQAASMKTEDPAGWISGEDMKSYLRYIYILSPENNQVYKYERLSNRYSAPDEYNVNGDLEGAVDMSIDGSIFVLKEGGDVVKLLRGEVQPFTIRHLPEDALGTATNIVKVAEGNIYFLDPAQQRVIVASGGGASGESSYIRQYVLEDDQIGDLTDIYVDPDETRLYVMDEKRIYKVDIGGG